MVAEVLSQRAVNKNFSAHNINDNDAKLKWAESGVVDSSTSSTQKMQIISIEVDSFVLPVSACNGVMTGNHGISQGVFYAFVGVVHGIAPMFVLFIKARFND